MKKLFVMTAVLAICASCSADNGEAVIQLPDGFDGKTLVVSHITIDNIYKAKKQEDLKVVYDTLTVEKGVARMDLDKAGPSRYNIELPVASRVDADFYAAPDEKIKVEIKSFEPLDYVVKGTVLMEDLTALSNVTKPIQMEYMNLVQTNPNVTEAQVKAIMDRYDSAIKKFVADNPESPAVPFAIMDLSGDDFMSAYKAMTPEARKSILMPYAELYKKQVEEMQSERAEAEAKKAEIASGTIPAPNFTLPDLSGKKLSLSDFKGKWVVIDFWGSWCGWCVKGFPALKDAYKKYGDKIVIIGVDCNESEADWRAGVKKFELPWINVYNGDNRELYSQYQIQGFPTKAIVNPEGMLVDLTTGEDPSFFDRLAGFLKK